MRDGQPADKNGHAPLTRDALTDVVYGVGGVNPFMTLPGIGGVPHRTAGAYSLYESGARPRKRGGQLHCEIYDVGDEKQRKAYEKSFSRVYTMVNAGTALVLSINRQFVAERCAWLVYFEWIELFTYDTTRAVAAAAAPPSESTLKPVRETVGNIELQQEQVNDATRSPEDC